MLTKGNVERERERHCSVVHIGKTSMKASENSTSWVEERETKFLFREGKKTLIAFFG